MQSLSLQVQGAPRDSPVRSASPWQWRWSSLVTASQLRMPSKQVGQVYPQEPGGDLGCISVLGVIGTRAFGSWESGRLTILGFCILKYSVYERVTAYSQVKEE